MTKNNEFIELYSIILKAHNKAGETLLNKKEDEKYVGQLYEIYKMMQRVTSMAGGLYYGESIQNIKKIKKSEKTPYSVHSFVYT